MQAAAKCWVFQIISTVAIISINFSYRFVVCYFSLVPQRTVLLKALLLCECLSPSLGTWRLNA